MRLFIQRPEQLARLRAIADDGIATASINDLSVTTGKLNDAAVTAAKLGAGAATLAKMTFTGLKVLAADGVNSAGGDTQVTLTGTAVGDRVVAIIGHVKANTGAHTFLVPTVGTHFESTISVVDKIVQKQAAGDLSANTYLFLIAPATS